MSLIPKPVLPTEEEMKMVATKWWEHHKGVNFHDWNDTMRNNSFDYRVCKLPSELIKRTIELMDGKKFGFDQLIDDYDKIIQPALSEMDCQNGFFVKTISRSPKDALANKRNSNKPFPLFSTTEAINAILSSMRCFEDLCMLYYLDTAALIIRPYIRFDPEDEWRVFIENKNIVGISQYYYHAEFEKLDRKYVAINSIDKIKKLINDIVIPNTTIDSYIADVVVGVNDDPTVVLELNPFGLSDPCLFKSYNKFDGCLWWNFDGEIMKCKI
jgi:hypothetical protein